MWDYFKGGIKKVFGAPSPNHPAPARAATPESRTVVEGKKGAPSPEKKNHETN